MVVHRPAVWIGLAALGLAVLVSTGPRLSAAPDPASQPARSGRDIFIAACASCHGWDGRGASASQVGFTVPLPDFTDCSFSSREPDEDWLAVAHSGGPERVFDPMMPAFGEALTVDELQRALDHARSFCRDDGWPRGDLNFPRAMFTEKAFVEDEAVLTGDFGLGSPYQQSHKLIYEQRLGSRSQVELIVPFGLRQIAADPLSPAAWQGGLGDVGVGAKHVLLHGLGSGSILSVAGEVVLPTGDHDRGFGKGTFALEPFLAYGQAIPLLGFVQLQVGSELPLDQRRAEIEVFWRLACGRSFGWGQWGRSFTPMIEVLGASTLSREFDPDWDVVPQLQVSLNRRQNLLAGAGVRIPVAHQEPRPVELTVYLLWDWFDGGLLEGW
ncbi:MAG: c-type cytochrome [Deltaproteobacteria bacterium]|nr:c-type cytochrome [Deltaproteobacteria bacterium]